MASFLFHNGWCMSRVEWCMSTLPWSYTIHTPFYPGHTPFTILWNRNEYICTCMIHLYMYEWLHFYPGHTPFTILWNRNEAIHTCTNVWMVSFLWCIHSVQWCMSIINGFISISYGLFLFHMVYFYFIRPICRNDVCPFLFHNGWCMSRVEWCMSTLPWIYTIHTPFYPGHTPFTILWNRNEAMHTFVGMMYVQGRISL